MAHVLELASSGRAKCRACGTKIAGGELRFGERLPNPFADEGGEMTHWFHPWCAAFRRPESFVQLMASADAPAVELPERDAMIAEAKLGVAHHRIARVNAAERASSGRAVCRACKQLIAKDTWRISLLYYEDGRFNPSGFVHVACAPSYLETSDFMRRLKHFSPGVSESDLAEIQTQVRGS